MGQAPPSTVLSVTVAAEGIAGLCCVVTTLLVPLTPSHLRDAYHVPRPLLKGGGR